MRLSTLCPRSRFPIRAHVIEALQHSPPREGAGGAGGSELPCPPASWPPAPPPTGPSNTHTHTHSGQTGRQTHGLSSSISLACPPPHTRAPSLPRRTGLQGVPSRHPCSPGPGELALPCPPCPGVGGSHPPRSRWCTCYCWTCH